MNSPQEPTWSDMAGWYDQLVERGSGPHQTAVACLLRMVGELAGVVVLDLACGQGLASRALAAAGATVTGIDATSSMIDLARARTDPAASVTYRLDDAQSLTSCADEQFDGVTCQLGLMDIPDLDATLEAVHRVLKPGGWFAFVIGHPCFLAPEAATLTDAHGRTGRFVHDYLRDRFWRSHNPNGVRRVGNYHRSLSTYLNALLAAGFALEQIDEPHAEPLLVEQQPVYANVPIFLAARLRRRP